MRYLLILLLLPVLLFGQGNNFNVKYGAPFDITDTLTVLTATTSGWQNIGHWRGSATFSIIFDNAGDSLAANGIKFEAQITTDGFETNGAYADSIVAGDSTGWMYLADIDSIAIADSLAWHFPLSSEAWWAWADKIRFRLTPAAATDTTIITRCRLRGI